MWYRDTAMFMSVLGITRFHQDYDHELYDAIESLPGCFINHEC